MLTERRSIITRLCSMDHCAKFFWISIANNRDNTFGPNGEEFKSNGIVSTKYIKTIGSVFYDFLYLTDDAAGFFYGYNIWAVVS